MAKKNDIVVKDAPIKTMVKNGIDYISITDIAKQKNSLDPNGVIANRMRNRNTVEFLGIWETLHTTVTRLSFLVYGKLFIIQILTPSNSRGLERRLV